MDGLEAPALSLVMALACPLMPYASCRRYPSTTRALRLPTIDWRGFTSPGFDLETSSDFYSVYTFVCPANNKASCRLVLRVFPLELALFDLLLK